MIEESEGEGLLAGWPGCRRKTPVRCGNARSANTCRCGCCFFFFLRLRMGKLKKKKQRRNRVLPHFRPKRTSRGVEPLLQQGKKQQLFILVVWVYVCMYGLLTTDAPLIRIGRGDSIRSGSVRGCSVAAKPSPGPGKLKSRPRPKDRNAANQSAIVNRTVSRDYELTALPPLFLREGKGCT